MKKILLNWLLFWVGIVFVIWISIFLVNAAWDTRKTTFNGTWNPTNAQKLTVADYNALVNQVKSLKNDMTNLWAN